jgi:hypothetical protein
MSDVLMRPEVYCVVPRDLAEELLEPLRKHFSAQGIAVIVERRDRRAHLTAETRRRRAMHLPRELPPLPGALAEHAAELKLVQRMPTPGLGFADAHLLEVVDAANAGDSVAASELIWRVHGRIAARLSQRFGEVVTNARLDAVLGRMLDRLGAFDGHTEGELLHWLDGVTDEA